MILVSQIVLPKVKILRTSLLESLMQSGWHLLILIYYLLFDLFTGNPTNGEKSRLFRLTSSIMRNKSAVLLMVTLGLLYITFNIWNVFYLESKRDCPDVSRNISQPLVYAAFGRKVICRFINTLLLGVYLLP